MHPAIFALVCGISPAKRAERLLCVIQPLQAYIDDSVESGTVLILAGYLANVKQWDEFSERWQRLLDMKPSTHSFKMRRVNLKNPVEREKAEFHYRAIEQYVPFGFCVALPIQPYLRICEELHIRKRYRRPFYMAWMLLLSVFRAFYTEAKWTQSLDLIFDENGFVADLESAWDLLARNQKEDMAPFKNRPLFRPDDELLPLQAADMLAWGARKNWAEHGTFNNQKWLFPWEERAPGPDYMFSEVTEDGIRAHVLANLSPSS